MSVSSPPTGSITPIIPGSITAISDTAHLVAARAAVGITPQDVADRMPGTRSFVSHLESGVHSRPTLTTIERCARAVRAVIEIRVRTRR
jgi:predicted transcriptional regulator